MMGNVCIYALVDPTTKEVRYVGQTDNATKRLTQHINGRPVNRRVGEWLAQLAANGRKPVMRILERVPYADCDVAEHRWMLIHRRTMLNIGPAGSGRRTGGRRKPILHGSTHVVSACDADAVTLEREARNRGLTTTGLIEQIVAEWCGNRTEP